MFGHELTGREIHKESTECINEGATTLCHTDDVLSYGFF